MNYKEFLKVLGNTDPICFLDNKIKISLEDVPQYIDKYNIYFIPNIGGSKKEDITGFKTFFVDLDAGKDSRGNFLPGKTVKKYKSEQWKKINAFSIRPNIVNETRNGLHLYWFIKEKITPELWQRIEDALVDYFDGDTNAKHCG